MKKIAALLLSTSVILSACGDKTSTITPEKYKELEKGMSIEEVEELIGGKPEKTNEISSTILEYRYKGENGSSEESGSDLIFVNNKLDQIFEDGLINPKKEPTKEEKQKTEDNLSRIKEDAGFSKIESEIKDKLGDKTNTGEDRIIKFEVNDHLGTSTDDDKIVLLTLEPDGNLTTKYVKKDILADSAMVFPIIFKNSLVEEATIFWSESDINVVKITITRETFNKINWEEFDSNDFENVADHFFLHESLR
ncbi:hypothetical protein SFC50_16125 [Bacillus infantis]|uniref:hypothetical protein n=1 Tax=Bacillus infantis TaxID=324767 RepID=UPI0039820641